MLLAQQQPPNSNYDNNNHITNIQEPINTTRPKPHVQRDEDMDNQKRYTDPCCKCCMIKEDRAYTRAKTEDKTICPCDCVSATCKPCCFCCNNESFCTDCYGVNCAAADCNSSSEYYEGVRSVYERRYK